MDLHFTKMHGLGNDFVVINAITQQFKMDSALALKLADRRFGIGCDQILIVENSQNKKLVFNGEPRLPLQCLDNGNHGGYNV